MFGYILCGTVCCCFPILGFIGFASFLIAAARTRNNKFALRNYLQTVRNWVGIMTFRSALALFSAMVLMLIAVAVKELSLFSTISVFVAILTAIFLFIAGISQIYISLKRKLTPEGTVTDTNLSSTEITEGETNTIKIQAKTGIPMGYVLKITEKMPGKLGGDLRGLATKTENGIATFEATIPKTKRGIYTIGPTHYTYQDVFGLSKINITDNSRFELTILPEIPQITKYNFKLSKVKGDENEIITARINTDDYYKTRPYVRGDDVRRIHWKLTAKTDQLIIREAETTTIAFKDLSIVILNTAPRVEAKSGKGTLPSKFQTAADKALDTQVKIAAGIIDFANRMHIPVNLYYFKNRKLMKFQPRLDDPTSWKYQLAKISLQMHRPDIDQLSNLIEKKSAGVFITSETNASVIEPVINASKRKNSFSEFIYVPMSKYMEQLFKIQKPEISAQEGIKKVISFLILTKPYFEQTDLFEKISKLMKKTQEKYRKSDIEKQTEKEEKFINYLHSEDMPLRVFRSEGRFASETDDIIHMLEYE